jgi:hypothetical protein
MYNFYAAIWLNCFKWLAWKATAAFISSLESFIIDMSKEKRQHGFVQQTTAVTSSVCYLDNNYRDQ